MYFIGYDIGSSSVKTSLVESDTGKCIDVIAKPDQEMDILSLNPDWAEQDPETWWKYVCQCTKLLLSKNNIKSPLIKGIGISYQMHGLVLIDNKGVLLRNSIIWCDGRAVEIGANSFYELGKDKCMAHLLNSPANFTASKLRWVQEHEPDLYRKTDKFMLPGDYIAYKFSDTINTTLPGLSEGIFWDFKSDDIADWLLDHYGLDRKLVPEIVPTFSGQCRVSKSGAKESGLQEGTPICYRAGDQPNNALSLNVFRPGEVAATGGTSGVFYAISDSYQTRENSGINNFAHVNHSKTKPRIGKLLCINGAGILYRWLLNNIKVSSYMEMNKLAAEIPIGSEGLHILPFGNGPERMLDEINPGCSIGNLNFNLHKKAHICRAALEGIAFSFVYGMELLKAEGIEPRVVRAGNDNLFRSDIFSQTISNLIDQEIEIYNNTGATGAARACGLSDGDFDLYGKQVMQQDYMKNYSPNNNAEAHQKAYRHWKKRLEELIVNK